MGQNDGCTQEKDSNGLPPLSSGYPCWTVCTTKSTGLNDWKAVCPETGTYSLVGGRWKRATSVPRQRPTQLAAVRISPASGGGRRRGTVAGSAPRGVQAEGLAQSGWEATDRFHPCGGT